ncbi:sigma 54-interacting transcriptional regulator [Clostridium rectalis]|uniref:sigma 54-interacting transcriptional regulator n=1 Tax=Clostridium rectalis TaxID=2040295 RepID=UPI000F63E60D|nr:sigma-54-dependent transcriptional regulator [Clostridium rectalis]
MRKIDEVYEALIKLEGENEKNISAIELSEYLNIDRSNVSRYLNKLHKEGKVKKIDGRPVLYHSLEFRNTKEKNNTNKLNSLDKIIGAQLSLRVPIQQAKAAILYPPRGLHTLILGKTGVGKSMFAELMYQFAKEAKVISEKAPFITFNCADYADNPQLVVSQIFGVKKGAYTGADSDKEGLLKKANGGILFLDEIHRLSPQGQEMLFTYIDKGFFRLLGDTEKVTKSEVQIIAATTEDPQSYLLKTFTRRIPMMIKLPCLKERTLQEKYNLLKEFITTESKRLSKNIYMDKNALVSFLLYDCTNNIGQLKSDIQLSCAKAFLDFKTKNLDYIFIEQGDLPKSTKKGFMKIQTYREEINKLLKNKGDILVFYHDINENDGQDLDEEDENEDKYFYDCIEKKLIILKNQGMNENEINDILNIDIESHFRKYMSDLPEFFQKEEITKIVNVEIMTIVDKILSIAKEKLDREFDKKIYLGLALHLQGSIDRIKQGNSIYNPKLNFIRAQYAEEFMVAIEIARVIDKNFNIETPLDEIGYLTMFLASNQYESDMKYKETVSILVIMHGKSTASSMVQVANELLGEECAEALDMPLNMKAETMYDIAKRKVLEMNRGKGILILVDMGSLTNFANMIYEETGISTKTIDMASTPMVIEACRKAMLGHDLDAVYNSCKELDRYGIQVNVTDNQYKKFLIITACFTGEGASEKLRDIITKSLGENSQLDIVSLNILDKGDFLYHVEILNRKYNILAVVGTINIFIKNVPFISASDILSGTGLNKLRNLIKREEQYRSIKTSLKPHINIENIEGMVDEIRNIVEEIESKLNISLSHDVKVGILLHIGFVIDRAKNGGKGIIFNDVDNYINKYIKEFNIIKQCLKSLEKIYDINISKDEEAYILKMFIENSKSV